ncbi:MAG TPA: hypothetical protein PKD64_08245 [Pirellulaceae bacterium]|nr:hypothetical protein [Pirellulaceae bacterium]HMO92177.1 hypothetical protein [Pirellulaceae bacterium]HMP68896.1 hypothetical protein [Pirellulaceae bacterium]
MNTSDYRSLRLADFSDFNDNTENSSLAAAYAVRERRWVGAVISQVFGFHKPSSLVQVLDADGRSMPNFNPGRYD